MADILRSTMEKTLTKNLLKYIAGRVMFCPDCDKVMDCKKTVSADFKVKGENKASWNGCTTCWDKRAVATLANIARLNEAEDVYTIEVLDSRMVYTRGK